MPGIRRALALVLFTVACTGPASTQNQARALAGRWDATVVVNGVEVPCRFDLSENGGALQGSFFNGDEKVSSTKGTLANGVLTLVWEQYGSTLTANVKDGQLEGSYDRRTRGLYPFHARRYTPVRAADNAPPIAGTWKVIVNGKSEKAWRFIVRQQGAQIEAAIQRVDGDTGVLSGTFNDGSFLLSHFDGARPMLLKVTPKADRSLELVEDASRTYTALRQESAEAAAAGDSADPFAYTRMKNPDEPLHFSFPDLGGRIVSDTDPRFRGKVVIATITGSWCPNCHDEAPFLVSLYRKYRAQGLEIVAISFEEAEQLANPARPRAFIKQFGIEYPFLLAGETDQLAAKMPQAENLDSFPTMFISGRDGRVRGIHAGYSSVATGELYTQTTTEITRLVERLLAEQAEGADAAAAAAADPADGGTSRRPRAEVTPVVLSQHVTPGSEVRLALKVRLPENIHVQSDKPRDPLLIPTVLTVTPPRGITLGKVVYPAASDLKQAGQKAPLAVFGREFELTVRGTVAAATAKGAQVVPGRLRYQACNAETCFPPASADVTWTLTIE